MKKIIIISIAALALLSVSGCNKSVIRDDASRADSAAQTMKATFTLLSSKESGDIYFPDINSGDLLMRYGQFALMCVPVAPDGTLEWDKVITGSCSTSTAGPDRTIHGDTYKSVAEWFSNATPDAGGEKNCVFFGMLTGGYATYAHSSYNTYYYDTDGETPLYTLGYTCPWHFIYDPVEDKCYARSYLRTEQSTSISDSEGRDKLYISDIGHIIGAHSAVVRESDIMTARFVNLSGYSPSTSLLRFKMTTTGENFDLSMIRIHIDPCDDNLTGHGFIEFKDFREHDYSDYPMISAAAYESLHGSSIQTLPLKYVKQADDTFALTETQDIPTEKTGYLIRNHYWSRYDEEGDYYRSDPTVPVKKNELTDDVIVSLMPQSLGTTAESYIIFEALDENGYVTRTFKKKLPRWTESGTTHYGFRGGVRYDFTVTFGPANSIITDNDEGYHAGYYLEDEWVEADWDEEDHEH